MIRGVLYILVCVTDASIISEIDMFEYKFAAKCSLLCVFSSSLTKINVCIERFYEPQIYKVLVIKMCRGYVMMCIHIEKVHVRRQVGVVDGTKFLIINKCYHN